MSSKATDDVAKQPGIIKRLPSLLVTDNAQGLSAELNSKGIKTTEYVFSCTSSATISHKLKTCVGGSQSPNNIFNPTHRGH